MYHDLSNGLFAFVSTWPFRKLPGDIGLQKLTILWRCRILPVQHLTLPLTSTWKASGSSLASAIKCCVVLICSFSAALSGQRRLLAQAASIMITRKAQQVTWLSSCVVLSLYCWLRCHWFIVCVIPCVWGNLPPAIVWACRAREIREKISGGSINKPTAFALSTAWVQIQRYLAWVLLICWFLSINFNLISNIEANILCKKILRQNNALGFKDKEHSFGWQRSDWPPKSFLAISCVWMRKARRCFNASWCELHVFFFLEFCFSAWHQFCLENKFLWLSCFCFDVLCLEHLRLVFSMAALQAQSKCQGKMWIQEGMCLHPKGSFSGTGRSW